MNLHKNKVTKTDQGMKYEFHYAFYLVVSSNTLDFLTRFLSGKNFYLWENFYLLIYLTTFFSLILKLVNSLWCLNCEKKNGNAILGNIPLYNGTCDIMRREHTYIKSYTGKSEVASTNAPWTVTFALAFAFLAPRILQVIYKVRR